MIEGTVIYSQCWVRDAVRPMLACCCSDRACSASKRIPQPGWPPVGHLIDRPRSHLGRLGRKFRPRRPWSDIGQHVDRSRGLWHSIALDSCGAGHRSPSTVSTLSKAPPRDLRCIPHLCPRASSTASTLSKPESCISPSSDPSSDTVYLPCLPVY
jgi:hypothetical protein